MRNSEATQKKKRKRNTKQNKNNKPKSAINTWYLFSVLGTNHYSNPKSFLSPKTGVQQHYNNNTGTLSTAVRRTIK